MSTPLQKARRDAPLKSPKILSSAIDWDELALSQEKESIRSLFPKTGGQPLLRGIPHSGKNKSSSPMRVGVVFSGGQASGGHNVIIGLFEALKTLHTDSQLFGFLDGPSGILLQKTAELTADRLKEYRNQGGFDLLGSGRTKIETSDQLNTCLSTMQKMQLDGLVIIGGDDSNTNAAVLAEYFMQHNCSTKVIGVPKTIDGDLQNEYVAISFGFDTASKTYSEIIGNIARDAISAKKYTHFIKLMGRSASHVALECALSTHPNLTFISEEVREKGQTLSDLTREIADLICARSSLGKNFSILLIPEGLIEFIPEVSLLIQELNQLVSSTPNANPSTALSESARTCFCSLPESIQKQLLLNRDPHGNVQVSLIETEQLFIQTVSHELEKRKREGGFSGVFTPMHHFLGYEGRAAFPTLFDCHYCYALGQTAALLLDRGCSGYMAFIDRLDETVEHWGIGGVPLTQLMHLEMRKGKEKAVVKKCFIDLKGALFSQFQQERKSWELEDHYLFPGPIQFSGDPSLTANPPLSIALS